MKKQLFLAALCICLVPAAPKAAGKQAPQRQADLCAVPPGAPPMLPAKLLPGMGTTKNFPVTTKSEEARKFFLQGVSQIHSFWFMEAERSCSQALELDPEMAMAQWCIALSAAGDYRPAFQLLRDPNEGGRRAAAPAANANPEAVQRTTKGLALNPQQRAKEAIQKAMDLRSKVTERERLYIEAQAARRLTADRAAADAEYIAGLRKLVAAYPDDLEAKSMLGLAIDNGFDQVTKEPRAHTMEAIALLEEVVKKDDDHFGAHHYLIHAWEGSKTPEKAWHACERYPALVPNIPHALHMPGHIYAQSDKIPEAIKSFSDAAVNELTWLNADSLYPNGHHGHNVHFLIHALNLAGQYQESMKRVQHLFTFRETPNERTSTNARVTWRQGYFALIKTLVRFEKWDEILDPKTIPAYEQAEQQAWKHWATGLAQAAKGQMNEARTTLAALEKIADAGREQLKIAALELEASIAARTGDGKKANEMFRKAADREAAIIYTEPPSYPRPVVEGWANVALAMRDFVTAERAYQEALSREPGSGRAYFGLAAALEGQGKAEAARAVRSQAARAWTTADRDLPQMRSLGSTTVAGQR